jgi:hypothetical protein
MPQLDNVCQSTALFQHVHRTDEQLVSGPTRQELQQRYRDFLAEVKSNCVTFYGENGRIMVKKLEMPIKRSSSKR